MGDNDRLKSFHPQGRALDMGLVQKITGHNHSRGNTFLFQADRIVRTARGTGASIADGGDDGIILQRNLVDKLRRGVF